MEIHLDRITTRTVLLEDLLSINSTNTNSIVPCRTNASCRDRSALSETWLVGHLDHLTELGSVSHLLTLVCGDTTRPPVPKWEPADRARWPLLCRPWTRRLCLLVSDPTIGWQWDSTDLTCPSRPPMPMTMVACLIFSRSKGWVIINTTNTITTTITLCCSARWRACRKEMNLSKCNSLPNRRLGWTAEVPIRMRRTTTLEPPSWTACLHQACQADQWGHPCSLAVPGSSMVAMRPSTECGSVPAQTWRVKWAGRRPTRLWENSNFPMLAWYVVCVSYFFFNSTSYIRVFFSFLGLVEMEPAIKKNRKKEIYKPEKKNITEIKERLKWQQTSRDVHCIRKESTRDDAIQKMVSPNHVYVLSLYFSLPYDLFMSATLGFFWPNCHLLECRYDSLGLD